MVPQYRCLTVMLDRVVIPSVNSKCLFISTTLILSLGLIAVAIVSTAVSHMCMRHGTGRVKVHFVSSRKCEIL